MVDKFKNEKESMKEQFRKEDGKRVEEINRIAVLNKKLKD